MATRGYQVMVVAAAPLYPTWQRQVGYRYGWYSNETRNGVVIRRVPTYVPKNTGFGQRVIYELVFCIMSLPLLIQAALKGIDCLVVTVPPLVATWAMILPIRRKTAIVKDLQVDIADKMGFIRHQGLLDFLYRIERLLLGRADLVTAVSRNMLRKIEKKGLKRPKIVYFPDWVDTERLIETPRAESEALRERLGVPLDKTVVGYSGNLARKQGIELIVDIARCFDEKGRMDVHFLVCGDGPAKPDLERLVAASGLANITLGPLQPEPDLPALLSAIDVNLVLQKDEVSDLVMPGKMFNVMSCSRPLVVTAPAGSAIDQVIEESGAGYRIARKQIDRIESAIEELCDSAELRAEMGRRGREWVIVNMAKRAVLDRFYSDAIEV